MVIGRQKYTVEEALFLRTVVKDALNKLNAARTAIANSDDMLYLMEAEDVLSVGESAWEKLKKEL